MQALEHQESGMMEGTFRSVMTLSYFTIEIHFEHESLRSIGFITPEKFLNLSRTHENYRQ